MALMPHEYQVWRNIDFLALIHFISRKDPEKVNKIKIMKVLAFFQVTVAIFRKIIKIGLTF